MTIRIRTTEFSFTREGNSVVVSWGHKTPRQLRIDGHVLKGDTLPAPIRCEVFREAQKLLENRQ